MGILTPFTRPHDVRWQGPQRHHHTIFLIKNILLVLFIIYIIVEYSLFKDWWANGPYSWFKEKEGSPYHFWLRIGLALIPDVIATVLSLILILNPLHHSTYSFHPVFALVSSIIMFSLYVNVCWLNPFLMYSNEVSFHRMQIWAILVYVETGVQSLLCLFWVAMMVCSCVAVHKWRVGKRAGERTLGEVERQDGSLADVK